MAQSPQRYTERCAVIAEKLGTYFDFGALVRTNAQPSFEPDLFENSLMCSWGDPATGDNKLFVYIHQVPDGNHEAEKLREMVTEEAPANQERQSPNAEAYEIHKHGPDEYVFVLNHVGRLTAIVGDCIISISPTPVTIRLDELADAALDIGRTVGCSAYINDFEPPTFDTSREPQRWTTADGLIYDPRTPPAP
jgi:hypothetical protein